MTEAAPMPAKGRLRPREHGAYAMLAFPCVSGLVLGGLSVPGVAVITAAVSGFLAHESVLVLLGARGARIKSTHEGPARRRLLALGAVSVLAVAAFIATAPAGGWLPAAVSASLAVGVGLLLLAGRTKTLPGELLVAATFASAHGVVSASGGAGPDTVSLAAFVWATSFALATLSVHALKYRFKGRGPGGWVVYAAPGLGAAAVAAAALAVSAGHQHAPILVALTPKALLVVGLSLITVHPRHLRRVGWGLVAADVLTLTLLAWALA